MRIFLTGATGFVGRALLLRLQRDGHQVLAAVRDLSRARSLLGADVELIDSADSDAFAAAIGRSEAVINLAGEPVIGPRWTAARREALTTSRVGVTRRVVDAMGGAATPPRVLISASAVGFYGFDGGDAILDESSPVAGDFLAELCQAWEAEARRCEVLGIRVCLARIGIVLGRDGGALAEMVPPMRFGVGGRMGSGTQRIPWIHLHDLVELLVVALTDPRYHGPVNATAPEPVPQRELAAAIGRVIHRSVALPVPAFALRLRFGAAATALLGGQRAVPRRLQELGFAFAYPQLDAALVELLGDAATPSAPVIEAMSGSTPAPGLAGADSAYLRKRRPTHLLRATTTFALPRAEVFDFFSRPANLGLITPRAMAFQLSGPPPVMADRVAIDYQIRVGPVPMRWRTRIESWQAGVGFVDSQERGPYRAWWHEHHFTAVRQPDGSEHTIMEDRVYYAAPLGPLGRLANALFIRRMLRRIFAYRADAVALRFGQAAMARAA